MCSGDIALVAMSPFFLIDAVFLGHTPLMRKTVEKM